MARNKFTTAEDLAAAVLLVTGGDRKAAAEILRNTQPHEPAPIASCNDHHAALHLDDALLRAECDYRGFQPDEGAPGLHLWTHRACRSTIAGPPPDENC